MLSIGSISASVLGAIALVPGGGATVAGLAKAFGYLFRCGTCLKILAVLAALGFTALHVHREDVAACYAQIRDDHIKAAAAAADRDKKLATDVNEFFAPKLDALHRQNQLLQDKVTNYAKQKAPATAAGKAGASSGKCRLGDAAGLLRPTPR